jgi:hypothetical protein
MPFSAQTRALIRESAISLVVIALAVWAATAIVFKILLIGTAAERIPVLPALFAPIGALAFPALAAAMGFSFAQGSAVYRGSANYRLGALYDRLASTAVERYIANLPPEALALLNRFAEYIEGNQRGRATSAEARRAIVQVANELRALALALRRQDRPDDAARYSEMAQSISTTVHSRRLRIEIDVEDGESDLRLGHLYTLRLKFEPESASPKELPAQFGSRSGLNLTLNLFGENISIQEHALPVMLPQWGESTEAATSIAGLAAGPCRLRVVVTTSQELEILQVYTCAFSAAAPVPRMVL